MTVPEKYLTLAAVALMKGAPFTPAEGANLALTPVWAELAERVQSLPVQWASTDEAWVRRSDVLAILGDQPARFVPPEHWGSPDPDPVTKQYVDEQHGGES